MIKQGTISQRLVAAYFQSPDIWSQCICFRACLANESSPLTAKLEVRACKILGLMLFGEVEPSPSVTTFVFIFLGVLLGYPLWIAIRLFLRRMRRGELMAKPLPPEWEQILERRFPKFFQLPESFQQRLTGTMHVFLDEKEFEPCGGLNAITDEIRVVVAVQACLLLTGIANHGFFPRLHSILIYPTAYRDRRRRTFDLQRDEGEVRLGESWDSGSVVLSWQSVLAGAAGEDDGINVVFHEFAHQLDQIDSRADGAPPLLNRGDYSEWSRVFSREYEALVKAAEDPREDPLLDTYGAQDPAEFFAVATEAFFEVPGDLKEEHPELYEQLTKYYGLDPTLWF